MKREQWRRRFRRMQRSYVEWQRFLLRWLLVGLAVVLIIVFIALMFSPLVRVQEISVQRTDTRLDVENVQRALLPFFGRHFLFLSQAEISAVLRRQFPDVESVEMNKVYPSEINVRIELQPIAARLEIVEPGAQEAEAGTGAHIDFLTSGGVYVQTPIMEEQDPLSLIRLVDWGARPKPGTELFSQDWLNWMSGAEQALAQQFGHHIESRTLYLRAQELHVDIGPYTLWFDLRSSLQPQLVRYRTFLQAVGSEAVTDYIDLRLADRVVYK